MDFLEVSAKTVDDAITKACIDLGLSSDQLDIQVISEGSAGFLGLGSKPAVIQVRKKEIPEEKPEVQVKEKSAEKTEKVSRPKHAASKEKKAEKSQKPAKAEAKTSADEAVNAEENPKKEAVVERTDEEVVTMKASASGFLEGVFKAMDLPVNITMTYNKEDDSLDIDFEGEDMGILIGKRGQTLDSLQYLVSLVVNRDQKNYVRVKLDTEDYRRRRRETLENLAKNIAYKVRRSRRSVSLEAMNPYERRIIHSALQNNRYVETHSEGNEPYRHVVVTAKRA
uniref:RNA-binding protein KhpB n=1 Tax=Eubacterium cellulosolvens (strain ATCC 43171 / JCM 9499 / 6) TaxID=633697 RepID=I5ATW9_EUBC6